MAEFDVKRVTTYQWMGIGVGVLAFINSFLPWYSVSSGPISGSINGWDAGFLGIVSILLLIAAAAIAALPLFGVQVSNGSLIWAGLAALAAVLVLIRWLTFDSAMGLPDGFEDMPGISAGISFGTIVGLLLALVSAVGGFLAYRGASTSTGTTDKAA